MSIQVRFGRVTVAGKGSSTDIVEASAKAYLNSLNRYMFTRPGLGSASAPGKAAPKKAATKKTARKKTARKKPKSGDGLVYRASALSEGSCSSP